MILAASLVPHGCLLLPNRIRYRDIFKYILIFGLFLPCGLVSVVASAESAVNEVVFDVGWDDFQPQEVDVRPLILDPPAGKHGRVVARGDKLFFADGTNAKFWGVGLTFSQSLPYDFPPDYETSKKLVKRLARLGFNHVRFVGLDNSARNPFKTWLRTGQLNTDDMDKLGYFIAGLRKAGIYYSFSIHNNAVALLEDLPNVPANEKTQIGLWKYKHIRLFNQDAVERIAKWLMAFYSWENPYTGLTIAEDPANIYVAAVNEDSIFQPYFDNFKHLDNYNRLRLNDLFDEYLIEKYGSWNAALQSWLKANPYNSCPGSDRLLSEKNGLVPPNTLGGICSGHRREIIRFLIKIDQGFYEYIRMSLREVGYQGLFTGTNNWYGYGNLYANYVAGDYIETHGYYDHPIRSRDPAKSEGYRGNSYIGFNYANTPQPEREHSHPLSKAFRSALVDRPLIISEWGQSAWSSYGYEGLAMLTAYAAFQGYPVLDNHTYFNHPLPNPRDSLTRKALSVSANPVLLSLMPSFATAFLRGDISSPVDALVMTCSEDTESFLEMALQNGLDRTDKICGIQDRLGYSYKLRTKLLGDKEKYSLPIVAMDDEVFASSTQEIIWNHAVGNSYLSVNAPRFKVAASPVAGKVSIENSYTVDFMSHGIVTVLSLDSEPIRKLGRVLITIAQSFRNSSMIRVRSRGNNWVKDVGHEPVFLTVPRLDISLAIDDPSGRNIGVCAMTPQGDSRPLVNGMLVSKEKNNWSLNLELGDSSGPWYLIGQRETLPCYH